MPTTLQDNFVSALSARKLNARTRNKSDLGKNIANIAEFIRTFLKPDSSGDGFWLLAIAIATSRLAFLLQFLQLRISPATTLERNI